MTTGPARSPVAQTRTSAYDAPGLRSAETPDPRGAWTIRLFGEGAAVSYGYDEQLIDAVAVRRRRIETALMFGDQRLRRAWSDRARTFVLAAFLAVIAAAGCVAVSFVTDLLSRDSTVRPVSSVPSALTPAHLGTPA